MCGITGWVSYDRDLRQGNQAQAIIEKMNQTMACRGPDANGIFLDSHAALGHRRLAVIDIEGGKQPMTVEYDGRVIVATTYSGEIYNFHELRSQLSKRGHTFRTHSDTEVALHAYLEWGEDFTKKLNGMYALALWDSRQNTLLLMRDRMGVKPLYYYPTHDGILFGSEPKAILSHPDARPVVDLEGLAELLARTKTPGHAVYKGMYEVRPGHLLRVRQGVLTDQRYWSLDARDHPDDLSTTVAHVRELLEDIVARQTVTDVAICTLLSGGLDSSVITALASHALYASGRGPIHSFAVDFVGQSDNFKADDFRGTPDGPYARTLAKHVKSEHVEVLLEGASLINPNYRAAVSASYDLPLGLGDSNTSLYLLFKEISGGFKVALSGEGADELFGGYNWFHNEDFIWADTFPWLAAINASGRKHFPNQGGRESLLDPALLSDIDLHSYRDARYRQALSEVPYGREETRLERRMREVLYLHLTRHLQLLLDRKDRISMAVGLEVRVPFCDHRLVEYIFNTPWEMQTFDGREKSLLRAAAIEYIPPAIAKRVKSPYPVTQDPYYLRALRADLRRILSESDSPVLPLLNHAAAAMAASGSGPMFRRRIELVLALDSWLRLHRVEFVL